MPWGMLFVTGMQRDIPKSDRKSWLCHCRALQDCLASVAVPINKRSIVVTSVFSGLVLSLAGTKAMLL